MKVTMLAVLLLYSFSLFAIEMNGIEFKKYKDFQKKWKLVTVRFRQDTEEMRFTYANELAYKTLKAGKTDYPDGAIFGKVGHATGHDPLFESSVVPNGARRFQLMVHDSKKYKEQNGWGYALFDERGIPYPEDQKAQVNACSACHDAAKERGYVFSQIAEIANKAELNMQSKISFEMVSRDVLPALIAAQIPKEFKFVRVLIGPMAKHAFQGTLEEIRPTLSKEALESRYPALLKTDDDNRFSVVFPENLGSVCNINGKDGIFLKSVYTDLNEANGLHTLNYCFTRKL